MMDRRQVAFGLALASSLTGAKAEDAGGARTSTFTSGGVPVAVERFAAANAAVGTRAPAVLLLHGADGLTYADRYRLAATLVAAAGYEVALVHYLDRKGERRVSYASLREHYPLWTATVDDALGWLADQAGVDPGRLGILGVSLGAALALSVAAVDRRVKAIVDVSGPLPEGLDAQAHLPPTLILHGEDDRIVPSSNARDLARRLAAQGAPHEIQIYPGQGHALTGAAQLDAASRIAAFLDRYLKAA